MCVIAGILLTSRRESFCGKSKTQAPLLFVEKDGEGKTKRRRPYVE